MRALFLDYGHYSTPLPGVNSLVNIDDKWDTYLTKSTVIANFDKAVQVYDKPALLNRLSAHRAGGGALISTSDFNVARGYIL
jgi:hypothetical protein